MESRAKIAGHPIHQMLIPFPLGLLATGVVFDVIYLVWGNPVMETVAFYMITAGILGGFLANCSEVFGTCHRLGFARRSDRRGIEDARTLLQRIFNGPFSRCARRPAWPQASSAGV